MYAFAKICYYGWLCEEEKRDRILLCDWLLQWARWRSRSRWDLLAVFQKKMAFFYHEIYSLLTEHEFKMTRYWPL